jgi:hypothetical protein
MRKKTNIPLIKENRIEKLLEVLECFYNYPFNRTALKDCILELYKGKDEKSVFRGMVIPSLRHLGLILGYEEDLRLSSNGNLIVIAKRESYEEGVRVFRTILIEIDEDNLNVFKMLERRSMTYNKFKQLIIKRIEAPSEKQAKERIEHWISMLFDVGLLIRKNDKIEVSEINLSRVKKDLDIKGKWAQFKELFFDAYGSIFKKQENIPIIDIEDIRREVAQNFFKKQKLVLTEKKFDVLLRRMPFTTNEYIISLGRAMGAEEKLFEYEKNYYRTLSIRFLNKEDEP